jgi:hypothetical protein
MRYLVIATVWSETHKKQIKKIMGTFNDYLNAHIFAEAYNKYYKADAVIEEAAALINQ